MRHATERMLDLTNSNSSLTDGLARQKFEYEQTATRLEDEQAQVANLHKKIKDLQSKSRKVPTDSDLYRQILSWNDIYTSNS